MATPISDLPDESSQGSVGESAQQVPGEPKPLRKDAERSRQLILSAAAHLFAERGIEVGFDEIARTAGVGVGTVYRRFPDRPALLNDLFRAKGAQALQAMRIALAIEDPWEALVWFCEHLIDEFTRDAGLRQVLAEGGHTPIMDDARDELSALADELVARAQRAGLVRPDLNSGDLGVMSVLVARTSSGTEKEYWRRYLAIVLDGIRAEGHPLTCLPGEPPTAEEFEAIMHRN